MVVAKLIRRVSAMLETSATGTATDHWGDDPFPMIRVGQIAP